MYPKRIDPDGPPATGCTSIEKVSDPAHGQTRKHWLIYVRMASSAFLPLFPLSSVLFPGVPIQLHIFEARYKSMIQACLQTEQDFGVVLIEEGREALGPLARTHHHGTTAQILKVQPLPEGRMNLVAIGFQRFRILSVDREGAPFLRGEVKFEEIPEPSSADNRAATALLPLVQQYVELIADTRDPGHFIDFARLPRDARALSYAAAYLLHVPQFQKQQLLELTNPAELIAGVCRMYTTQIELLKIVQRGGLQPPGGPGGVSLN